MTKPIRGLIPPLVTPLKEGQIDVRSLERLVDHLSPYVDGYLVGGSVGESSSLSLSERIQVLEVVAARKPDGHVLAVVVSDNALPHCQALAEAARAAGADLAVFLAPSYYAISQSMLREFAGGIASCTSLPLCLYDNPQVSGLELSVPDMLALHEAVPAVTYVKVTDPRPEKVLTLRRESRLRVFAGEDAVLWHMLARGADGAMVGLSMIYPEATARLWAHFRRATVTRRWRPIES